jgi:hypothetical protein
MPLIFIFGDVIDSALKGENSRPIIAIFAYSSDYSMTCWVVKCPYGFPKAESIDLISK